MRTITGILAILIGILTIVSYDTFVGILLIVAGIILLLTSFGKYIDGLFR
jgi:uncharacterized membrane protein HdeD (DUF308 family)